MSNSMFSMPLRGADMSSLDLSSEQFVEMSMGAQPQDVTTLHVSSYAGGDHRACASAWAHASLDFCSIARGGRVGSVVEPTFTMVAG